MAYLRVYMGDKLLQQREVSSKKTTIGRSEDNDIVLQSNGVSKRHAVIEKHGNSFVLIDNDSANGVYLNGQRIKRHILRYWDEIQIFSYVIKFMALTKLQGDEAGILDQVSQQLPQDATVAIDISSLGDLAKLRKKVNVATVTLFDGQEGSRSHQLDKVNFTIGMARDCDIHIPGWFGPRRAAVIQHRSDGFYLIPSRRGKVMINRMVVSKLSKLADGDDLQVRGVVLKFYFRPTKHL